MEEKKELISQSGYDEVKAELEYLNNVKMPEISVKISEAREQGDLSENAEYLAAREEQAEVNRRITELENILKTHEVAVSDIKNKSKVSFGSLVTVYLEKYDEERQYKIVGSAEANTLENKIGNDSPLGMALLGRKKGEKVAINAPSGEIIYEIKAIDNTQ